MSAVAKVVVIGPESTGKTTLARGLAVALNTVWAPEYARYYYPLKLRTGDYDPGDIPIVARGQMRLEAAMARVARRVLVCDTNVITTAVYSRHYYGDCPEWIERAADAARADLYLLLDVDVPWMPDPLRDRPHEREAMLALFRAALERRGFAWRLISGDWPARLPAALAAIDAALGLRPD